MKILMVATNYEAPVGGGGQKSLKVLVDALIAAGHEVVIAALAHEAVGTHLVDGATVHYLPARNVYRPTDAVARSVLPRMAYHALDVYNPLSARDVRQVIKNENPDVVHTHVLTGFSVSAWSASKALGVPVVHTIRDQYLLCARSTLFRNGRHCSSLCAECAIFRWRHRDWSMHVDAVIGVSRYVLDEHCKRGYFEQAKIKQVIYNARDAKSLGCSNAKTIEPRKAQRFGFIGSLTPSKGIELLISSFLSLDRSDVELLIAGTGDGVYDEALRQRYQSERIHFLGRVRQRDFFPEVDVVVVPSLWNEPLGMVVAEAFAFGRPVIGASRGGISEMIEHGHNGLVFDPDTPNELRDRLSQILSYGQLNVISDNARESAKPFLNMTSYAGAHTQIYSKLYTSPTKRQLRQE
ncbi:glycosyltransferase family 4 protein [Luteimonas sp. TWI662]|uniref:glycosyltransferase family 4 protein n=1 Tax=Luteimonas sp. TWI662 TaxID=3136789 RepID=UPI00320B075A